MTAATIQVIAFAVLFGCMLILLILAGTVFEAAVSAIGAAAGLVGVLAARRDSRRGER